MHLPITQSVEINTIEIKDPVKPDSPANPIARDIANEMADETTPLLGDRGSFGVHGQFCELIGIPSSGKADTKHPSIDERCLYRRVTREYKSQNITYNLTAALSNTLLLSQVVLGATLTALGASESSHVLITIFGVLNTIIAGLVAYLKSRGQPMRARMFRDDLEHVISEIEDSETMWLGIQNKIHGYDEIDVDDEVSVRSEVARLTRLYESQVKKHIQNNPDLYNMGGGILDPITGLRSRPAQGAQPLPAATAAPASAPVPAQGATNTDAADAEESPATAKDDVKADKNTDKGAVSKTKDDKGKSQGEDTGANGHNHQSSTADVNGADPKPNATPNDTDKDSNAAPASAATPPKTDKPPSDPGKPGNSDKKDST